MDPNVRSNDRPRKPNESNAARRESAEEQIERKKEQIIKYDVEITKLQHEIERLLPHTQGYANDLIGRIKKVERKVFLFVRHNWCGNERLADLSIGTSQAYVNDLVLGAIANGDKVIYHLLLHSVFWQGLSELFQPHNIYGHPKGADGEYNSKDYPMGAARHFVSVLSKHPEFYTRRHTALCRAIYYSMLDSQGDKPNEAVGLIVKAVTDLILGKLQAISLKEFKDEISELRIREIVVEAWGLAVNLFCQQEMFLVGFNVTGLPLVENPKQNTIFDPEFMFCVNIPEANEMQSTDLSVDCVITPVVARIVTGKDGKIHKKECIRRAKVLCSVREPPKPKVPKPREPETMPEHVPKPKVSKPREPETMPEHAPKPQKQQNISEHVPETASGKGKNSKRGKKRKFRDEHEEQAAPEGDNTTV